MGILNSGSGMFEGNYVDIKPDHYFGPGSNTPAQKAAGLREKARQDRFRDAEAIRTDWTDDDYQAEADRLVYEYHVLCAAKGLQ